MSFTLKIMEIKMRSEVLQASQLETNSQDLTSAKVIRKNLFAYWVMEDGKLICKWIAQ